MKNIFTYLLVALSIIMFNQCQNKQLELDLVETACKSFKISEPSYLWGPNNYMPQTPCGGNVKTVLQVSFKYKGDKDCIDKISINPIFYKSDNSVISGVTSITGYTKRDPNVLIADNTITLTDTIIFSTPADANALSFIYMKINTENDLGAKSNNLEIRITTPCSTISPSTYAVQNAATPEIVTSSQITLFVWDYAAEDDDIISVYLNGKWVIENFTISHTHQAFTLNVNPGDNDLAVFANNQGKSGPNTCAIQVNTGGKAYELSPGLLTGQAIKIKW